MSSPDPRYLGSVARPPPSSALRHPAGPGDFLHVPPGGLHGFRNESGRPASLLILAEHDNHYV